MVTGLTGAAGSVWQLLVLRLLNGLFAGFIPMAVSLQASITPNENAGKALGTLQTGSIAGNLLRPLIGGVLAERCGFRRVFFITGALLIVAAIIVMFFVHEAPRSKLAVEKQSTNSDLRQLKPLLPIFVVSTLAQMGMMSIEPIVSIYAKMLYTGSHLVTFCR